MLRASKYNVRALSCSTTIPSSIRPLCAVNSGIIVPSRALHSSNKVLSNGRAAFGYEEQEASTNGQRDERTPRNNWPQQPQNQWAPPRALGASVGGNSEALRPNLSGRTSGTLQPIRPPPARFSMPTEPSSQSSSQSKLDELLRGAGAAQSRLPNRGINDTWSRPAPGGGIPERGGFQSAGQPPQAGYPRGDRIEQYLAQRRSTQQPGAPYGSQPPRPYGSPTGAGAPPPYNAVQPPQFGSQLPPSQGAPPRFAEQGSGTQQYNSPLPPRNNAVPGVPPYSSQLPPQQQGSFISGTQQFNSPLPPRNNVVPGAPPYNSQLPPRQQGSFISGTQQYNSPLPPRNNAVPGVPPYNSQLPPRQQGSFMPNSQFPPPVGAQSPAPPSFNSQPPPRVGTASQETQPPINSQWSSPPGTSSASPHANQPITQQSLNSTPNNTQIPPQPSSTPPQLQSQTAQAFGSQSPGAPHESIPESERNSFPRFSSPTSSTSQYGSQAPRGTYAPATSQYGSQSSQPSNTPYSNQSSNNEYPRYGSQSQGFSQQNYQQYPRFGAQSSNGPPYNNAQQFPRFGAQAQDSSQYNNRQPYQRQNDGYRQYDRPQSGYLQNQNNYSQNQNNFQTQDGWNGGAEGAAKRLMEEKKLAAAALEEAPAKAVDTRRKKGDKGRDKDKRAFGATQSFLVDESELNAKKDKKKKKREDPIPIYIPQFTSVSNLSKLLKVPLDKFVYKLKDLGFEEVNHDHVLGSEDAGLIAMEYNFDPIVDTSESEDLLPRPPPEDKSLLPPRPPVVTIMGHVDHGKTTLLDFLRKSSVAASEHGGITQHIGAFSVNMPSGKQITFLDTPGHAAFLTMRERGANATDIVILVVAADDSVMPQTIEAIKHAKSANVPMIVALNKVDRENANLERVKHDLAINGVEIEDFGGDTQVIPVSGKTGFGMQDLEEATVLLSEILDMRAETDGPCEGYILEATTKKRGRVATILVRRGTLRPGDILVAGQTWARVRNLLNEAGQEVESAGPGIPVEVDGWRDQPDAGDLAIQAPTEDRAKSVASFRTAKADRLRQAADMEAINEARKQVHEKEKQDKLMISDPEAATAAAETAAEEAKNETKCQFVNFVVKADVSGSVEAIVSALGMIGNDEVRAKVIRSSFGTVSEFDVDHAAAAGGIILSFNLPIDPLITNYARIKNVQILQSNIIYRLTEDVTALLSEKLPPLITTRVTGEAEIIQVFDINIKKKVFKPVAGCRVKMGSVTKASRVRVRRKKDFVWDGQIASLKNVQKDVSEMKQGTECGIGLDGFDGFLAGDVIQCYTEVRTKRTLPFTGA